MVDNRSMNRIIGDYFEVNSDIINREFNSKLPKFISKFISNKQRNRLLDSLNKFRSSNYILTYSNLIEFFTYVYNNFGLDGYKNIVKVELKNDAMEVLMNYDGYYTLIYFDNLHNNLERDQKFNLRMRYIGNNNSITGGIDIYLDKLDSNYSKGKDMVERLNVMLKEYICDYIEETIRRFMLKEK